MRTRELLVPVELRIRFPHRLEPPVPREVEMVVGVFKRSDNWFPHMAALTGKASILLDSVTTGVLPVAGRR